VSEFQTVRGFEDVWRPPARPRQIRPLTMLAPRGSNAGGDVRARLVRVVNRAPEVMVKVTGRTREAGQVRAHLDYISRNGALELEDRDGAIIDGRTAVKEVAEDWAAAAMLDSRRRVSTPFSHSVMLSMPAGTDTMAVRDAARAFAREVLAERFDYVFALHTDADHPHVHIAVRSLGEGGQRLNPKKADLEAWRQVFAQALRDRGVEAEATPRRARGVTRKPERASLRKIRERHEAGKAEPARVRRAAYQDAAKAAFGGQSRPTSWETRLVARQGQVRALYLAQAQLLGQSPEPADRALAEKVEAFVRAMPVPDSQRLALARELRAANAGRRHHPDGRERSR
jgi:hypothetical protein